MDKLTMKSPDLAQLNVDKIGLLFPNVITEVQGEDGLLRKAIDFDLLKQELSSEIIEGDKERYQLTWPGKKESILQANSPIDKTLRPVKEDSVDWDNTQNIYIEGDNLEVLKLLQESYLNKVKCIYIDPPYNTGSDFIYKDDYRQSSDDYLEESGQIDEQGNRLFQNNESNGRFHSDWLTMMYSRLKLSRSLLSDDGVILISIDDNEYTNLTKIMSDIFGESNHLVTFVWRRRASSSMADKLISVDHEYVVCYQKTEFISFSGVNKDYKNYANPDNDPEGDWTKGDLTVGMTKEQRPNQYYDLIDPNTGRIYAANPRRVWTYIPERMATEISNNRIIFPEDGNGQPMFKRYKKYLKSDVNPVSSWISDVANATDSDENGVTILGTGLNSEGTKVLQDLFGDKVLDYPKPLSLIKSLINHVCTNDDLIMDFFSGSATLGNAIFEINSIDKSKLKFILVQLPEIIENNVYKNICELGKERLRKAAKKVKEESNCNIDYGFRVYRLDTSNMKEVYYLPDKLEQQSLVNFESNIKDDRSSEDLLIQVMLELGLELSLPMETRTIQGKQVYFVAGNSLVACFDSEVNEILVKEIAKAQPLRVVFRDSSFANDAARINLEEIFKLLSPVTEIKVI